MTKEDILMIKKARLAKLSAKAEIKSYGAINKLRREIRHLEDK